MKMTKPCALEIFHNKHREKKKGTQQWGWTKEGEGFKTRGEQMARLKGERWGSWGLVSKPIGGEARLVLGFNQMKPKLTFFIWWVLGHMGLSPKNRGNIFCSVHIPIV